MGGIIQTSHRSSHTSIILRATPTASRINGTGMKAAADCNTFKACFPVAIIYCAVEGMTSREMEFVSISRSSGSTEVRSSIAETIARSIPADSCMQMCVSRWKQDMNQPSHRRPGIRLQNSVPHRGTLVRCQDVRKFILRQFLYAVSCQEVCTIWFDAHCSPQFLTFWL